MKYFLIITLVTILGSQHTNAANSNLTIPRSQYEKITELVMNRDVKSTSELLRIVKSLTAINDSVDTNNYTLVFVGLSASHKFFLFKAGHGRAISFIPDPSAGYPIQFLTVIYLTDAVNYRHHIVDVNLLRQNASTPYKLAPINQNGENVKIERENIERLQVEIGVEKFSIPYGNTNLEVSVREVDEEFNIHESWIRYILVTNIQPLLLSVRFMFPIFSRSDISSNAIGYFSLGTNVPSKYLKNWIFNYPKYTRWMRGSIEFCWSDFFFPDLSLGMRFPWTPGLYSRNDLLCGFDFPISQRLLDLCIGATIPVYSDNHHDIHKGSVGFICGMTIDSDWLLQLAQNR